MECGLRCTINTRIRQRRVCKSGGARENRRSARPRSSTGTLYLVAETYEEGASCIGSMPSMLPAGKKSYWNNTIHFTGASLPVYPDSLQSGSLVVPQFIPSPQSLGGGGHAILTANGSSNAVLWFVNGGNLLVLEALTLQTIYASNAAANGRDTLPPLAHFATPSRLTASFSWADKSVSWYTVGSARKVRPLQFHERPSQAGNSTSCLPSSNTLSNSLASSTESFSS